MQKRILGNGEAIRAAALTKTLLEFLQPEIKRLPDDFFNSFNYTCPGNNLTHSLVTGLLARLCPFINPVNIPIGFSQKGWETLDEFVQTIRGEPGGPVWVAREILQIVAEMPCLVVNGHHVLNQLDGRSFTVTQVLCDAAAQLWGCACEISDLNKGMGTIFINAQPVVYHAVTFSRGSGPSATKELDS
jgi:hypothetical protein